MLRLALPVLAEESLTLLVGYTDWWLAGHFLPGQEYKAAMGLMAYVMWLIPGMFSVAAIGATAMIARYCGAGDRETARRVAHQAVLVGCVLAAGGVLLMAAGGSTFMRAMQLETVAADLTLRYTWIIIPVIPAIMIEQVGAACLRGAGDTVSGFLAKSLVNVVNVIVSTWLVLGGAGVPKLGWEGIAIGTACGHGLGGLPLLVFLLRGRAGLQLRLREMRPAWDLLRRLLRIGWPGGVDMLAVLTCHLIYVAIINSVGTAASAAHGLGLQIEALAYLPCTAFQVAAMTMTGQYLGAGDVGRARHAALVNSLFGVGLLTLTALVFYFGGGRLTAIFTGNAADPTAQESARLLKIVAFSTPPMALLMVLTGVLRGAGDTRWPLGITFAGLIGIRLPLACWFAWSTFTIPGTELTLTGWGWGVAGAWLAMATDVTTRSLLTWLRYLQGGWTRTRI